ncbi:MAG: ImmA/IrrE family metallo-endopeptidase [bacterium]
MAVIRANYELARERAAALLDSQRITSPPVKVHEIAGFLGLNIKEARWPQPHSNEIQGYLNWGTKEIVLNAEDSFTRKRFTIAHEIGHVKLHEHDLENDPDLGIMFRQNMREVNPDHREREANYFAACLLMPSNMVRRFYSVMGIADLATMFIVSESAMSYRIESLKKEGVI